MNKTQFDRLQILFNDLSIWQPNISVNDDEVVASYNSDHIKSTFNTQFRNNNNSRLENNELPYGSSMYDLDDFDMRRKLESEFIGARSDTNVSLKPSLASLVVSMTNVEISLLCQSDKTTAQYDKMNSYKFIMNDFRFFAALKHEGKNDTYIVLDNDQFSFLDQNDELIFNDESNVKETDMSLFVNGITLSFTKDPKWTGDLIEFLQEPEMLTSIEIPSQFTKLSVIVRDCSIIYQPEKFPARVVFAIDCVKLCSNINPDSPMFSCKFIVQRMDLMLIDDVKSLNNNKPYNRFSAESVSVKKYWKSLGFVKTASLDFAEILLRTNKETCADAFQTLIALMTNITSKNGTSETKVPLNRKERFHRKDINLDALKKIIEEDVFTPLEINSSNPEISNSNLEFDEKFYGTEEDDKEDYEKIIMDDANEVSSKPDKKKNIKPDITFDDDISSDSDNKHLDSDNECLNFEDDHFSVPTANELENINQEFPKSLTRIKLNDFNVIWKLYDGYDWKHTKDQILDFNLEKAPTNPIETTESISKGGIGPSISETNNINNINYYSNKRPESITNSSSAAVGGVTNKMSSSQTNKQRINSSRKSKLDIKLDKINLEFDIFPANDVIAFRLLLLVQDIEIIDNIKTSAWHKFLTQMHPDKDTKPRESKSNMIRFELNSIRSIPSEPAEEFRIKLQLLPLRFYIDQDALNFSIGFFSYKDNTININQVEDDTYFQYFEIQPIVMKIDYKPKHIDYTNLKGGNLVELMNFFHFEAAEMTLRSVKLTGVKGWQRLFEELGAAWLPHIKNTQVPSFVSGVTPIRSLVNIGSGVADLILLPIEQYKKDGRIIRGLQKGTQSFARATTMEAIKFGTKLAVGTQILLEHADEILSFETQPRTNNRNVSEDLEDNSEEEDDDKELISKYANPPADLNEGIEAAYKSLRQNIGAATHTIFAVPMEVYEKTGTQGTVKAVIRAVPVAVLKPMIGASEAVSKTLLGLTSTMDPTKRPQMED
ncbi:16048_t:CDS:10 [Entrophospora sp. SA101]|nr:16037_t:CDS:10 [Entrophospora sp. SA101]CAJ0907038.1 16042_t:CDS:10 [Entrophospora sp. SA101]CAJ0907061.1 16048_t:CDS:10 [Entrophospora sp. SA101]